MAIEFSSALSSIVAANLTAAEAAFPNAALAWHWEQDGDTGVRYVAEYVDADNVLRLVIAVPWTAGPSHNYQGTVFSFEDETVISSVQTRTNTVLLPPPSASQRLGFVDFAAVLAYVTAFAGTLQ